MFYNWYNDKNTEEVPHGSFNFSDDAAAEGTV
jgi:hypothetical protein